MILGLDISTSITGFAVVGEGELLHYSSIDLRKHKGMFEKAEAVKEELRKILGTNNLSDYGL